MHGKQILKRKWPCPKKGCPEHLAYEQSSVAEVTAYCIKCGYRLVVTNVDLAKRIAADNPVMALRMLVDGQQWENICDALGGKGILIPLNGSDKTTGHCHIKQRKRRVKYSREIEDKVVKLKIEGKPLKEIARHTGLKYSTVSSIIYSARRGDLNTTRRKYNSQKREG